MIEIARGNLLEADAEALVNTVNCVGVMGKGIALQFKQAFPDNYHQYVQACRAGQVQPGRMFVVSNNSLVNPKYIINFPTKRHWKGKSQLEDIQSGLEALISEVRRLGIRSIAIPALGCNNGGLQWSQVGPLIKSAFAQVPDVSVLLFAPQDAPTARTMPVATARPTMTHAHALYICLMELYNVPGYELSRLEIQKLAYLLQATGEPLKLRYVKHKYGPYAENLNQVLQRLEGHYIRGYGDRSGRAAIHLLPGATMEAHQLLADAPTTRGRLDRVRRLIEGFETPYGMELLTSVHWVAQEDLQAAANPSVAITAVHAWNERKRTTFEAEHIRMAWERLRDQDWLPATTFTR